jgi:hypothetical protein
VGVVLFETNESTVIPKIACAAAVLGQNQVHPSSKAFVLDIIQRRLFMGVRVVVADT